MRHGWIKRGGGDRVCVIALGWASGPELVGHLAVEGGPDVLALYDYRSLETSDARRQVYDLIASYHHRSLVAWSFGVWVAERVFPASLFHRAIAVNGTPLPADEKYGIGSRRLTVTLMGLQKTGLEGFNHKAYGPWYGLAATAQQDRDLAAHIAELETLTKLSAKPYQPQIGWEEAIVGSEDEIFPPANMRAYWQSKVKTVPLPHFPFGDETVKRTIFETR